MPFSVCPKPNWPIIGSGYVPGMLCRCLSDVVPQIQLRLVGLCSSGCLARLSFRSTVERLRVLKVGSFSRPRMKKFTDAIGYIPAWARQGGPSFHVEEAWKMPGKPFLSFRWQCLSRLKNQSIPAQCSPVTGHLDPQ